MEIGPNIACVVTGSYIQIWEKNRWRENKLIKWQKKQKADDVFLGRLSRASKKYAENFYKDSYFFQSVTQGILTHDEIIEEYIAKTASFDDPDAISREEFRNQFEKYLADKDLIIFLGTREYIDDKIGWTRYFKENLGDKKDRLLCPLEDYNENLGLAKVKDAEITGIPLFFSSKSGNTVRLKNIQIFKLFKEYDYPNINLFDSENLTILTAPNGYGKTTILEMIYKILSLKVCKSEKFKVILNEINKIPFDSLRLEFDSGSSIQINHSKKGRNRHLTNETHFFLPQLIESQNEQQKFEQQKKLINSLPLIPVKLIKSSRLTEYSEYSIRKEPRETKEGFLLLKHYSDEIKERISSLFSVYGDISEDYDCTAMTRLTKLPDKVESFHEHIRESYPIMSRDEAVEALEELKKQRIFLRQAGFISVNEKLSLAPNSDNILDDPQMLKAITLHIRDCQEKYELFDLLSVKIRLLQDIINDLFIGKELSVSQENGFEIIRNGEILDITKLSSGEQHQIVLYYDLIFNTEPGTLVLIDEPEISLHLVWQRALLKNLEKIAETILCDFIIATHSADIINTKWNQIVQLCP